MNYNSGDNGELIIVGGTLEQRLEAALHNRRLYEKLVVDYGGTLHSRGLRYWRGYVAGLRSAMAAQLDKPESAEAKMMFPMKTECGHGLDTCHTDRCFKGRKRYVVRDNQGATHILLAGKHIVNGPRHHFYRDAESGMTPPFATFESPETVYEVDAVTVPAEPVGMPYDDTLGSILSELQKIRHNLEGR